MGCQSLARDMDESILRVMLGKLSAHEIIDSFIQILRALYDTDESFHEITKHITTIVQVLEIQREQADLRSYEEKRQKELFLELLNNQTKCVWKRNEVFEATFKDWKTSGLTFYKWVNGLEVNAISP